MSYGQDFSDVYDRFTGNADYAARAAYQFGLLRKYGIGDGILLDLACGTGTLSEYYLNAGFDVIDVDRSADMLMRAREKLGRFGGRVLFLQQDMTALDLYGTVRAAVCSLDAMNHLLCEEELLSAFRRVSLFTEPGGVFLFDMNTAYKHLHVLGNNTFVYEDETAFLVWQNETDPETLTVNMALDIFQLQPDGSYLRSMDEITERAYSVQSVKSLLQQAGFSDVKVYGDIKTSPPAEDEERICYLAIK